MYTNTEVLLIVSPIICTQKIEGVHSAMGMSVSKESGVCVCKTVNVHLLRYASGDCELA